MILADLPPVGNAVSTRSGPPLPEFDGYHSLWLESGTAALALALLHVRHQRPDIRNPEVLLPAYGCPDLVAAAVYAGLSPVLVDIGGDDPGYDPDALKTCSGDNTVAIVAVNFLGIRERLEDLRSGLPGVALIEDNAQWHPEGGLSGDYVVTSFGRGKPASVLGGGLLLVHNKVRLNPRWLEEQIAVVRRDSFSATLTYRARIIAYNILRRPWCYFWMNRNPVLRLGETRFELLEEIARMPASQQALVGANRKRHLQTTQWREVCYDRILGDLSGLTTLPVNLRSRRNRLLRYPVLCENRHQRDRLLSTLNDRGLGASPMYRDPLPVIEGVPSRVVTRGPLSNARLFADRLITLPLHTGVRLAHIHRIAELCERVLAGAGNGPGDVAPVAVGLARPRPEIRR
ncbi:DegT/DnrJ/EryC1/StrS family aminotransferase [Gilvimarinus sp. F26214L]|uniref:DegT/DnrJ/EryC1/StrS family aminotransferase n=1 Tax=Gilvimarinus sp. DZF01 TaxID=3461371 RepID=UPI0040452BF1